jgi:peptidylprolyl isomerase
MVITIHHQTIEGLRVHLPRFRVLSAAVIPLIFLAACGSAKTAATPTSELSAQQPSALDVVTMAGTDKVPTLTFKTKPMSVKETTVKVVRQGTGATVTKADLVTFNVAVYNGKDGKEIESSFGKPQPARADLSDPTFISGLTKGLVDQKIGSRVLVALPPAEVAGLGVPGVGPTDTVVFLFDLISATTAPPKSAPSAKPGPPPLKSATGAAVPPKAGLPTAIVDATNSKAAQITIPKTAAPTTLIVQPLIKGAGPVVKTGQSITVHYTGVLWKDGSKFDASGDRGEPFTTAIGVGQVVTGWDKGLVGQTVGSRILLVIPPADGYGAKGSPPKIGPTDTLVFVVDILAAN